MPDANRSSQVVSALRVLIVAVFSLIAMMQIVRNAFVVANLPDNPGRAARAWASHPDVLFQLATQEIANAAAAGKPIPNGRIRAVYLAAGKAPLAPEPFLIRGVEAQLAGQEEISGRALEAARRRDPRSLAAHYFLADHYLRTNQPDEGLAELARLTRMVPSSIATVAPYYASYAQQPGGAQRVRNMLRAHPEFEADVLGALAENASNADLVLYLAGAQAPEGSDAPAWHGKLVESLVQAGQYGRARSIWSKLSGEAVGRNEIFDAGFAGKRAPPPFNWTLLSSASGLAEGQTGGRLHIVYYGRDAAILAAQTLTLEPGRYRFSFQVRGGSEGLSTTAWKIACLPSEQTILSVPLAGQGTGRGAEFRVSPGCPAQLLSLEGAPPDFPQTVDATLSGLRLERLGS